MKDFLGQELAAGDFIAYPGAGNGRAEYGMILMRILYIKETSIRVERLTVKYPGGKAKISRSQSSIVCMTKFVKVQPPENMIEVFQNPDEQAELVATWIHGKEIDWNTLTAVK